MAAHRDAGDGSHRDPLRQEEALRTLQGLVALRRQIDRVEHDAVQTAREHGATLETIANALGVTRQAVHIKLKKLDAPQLVVGVGSLREFADAVLTLFS